jgi:hypothetical protein
MYDLWTSDVLDDVVDDGVWPVDDGGGRRRAVDRE